MPDEDKQGELGEDVVEPPPPLTEQPPHDRFCDLVLNGGVASGVVYPWAVLELARHYRFRSIGGTSVGAMAAALTAAAEYGRRNGYDRAFEVLRRVPGRLAETNAEGTKLLALFQPSPKGRRLFGLFVKMLEISSEPYGDTNPPPLPQARRDYARRMIRMLWSVVAAFSPEALRHALVALGLVLLVAAGLWAACTPRHGAVGLALSGWGLAALVAALAAGAVGIVRGLLGDIRLGIVDNNLGLCTGGDVPGPDGRGAQALTSWLHEGIQRAAGMGIHDALTFADLWSAPLSPGDQGGPVTAAQDRDARAIDLEMITTNVTFGRPFRLPLLDSTSRLFFLPSDLKAYFPDAVNRALLINSQPYQQRLPDEPDHHKLPERLRELREMPAEKLPVVVAARMSLSFPVLFSAVPLYAIDREAARAGDPKFERCWFSDGGLCSNFPIHLFDAALPQWPTFGMWIGRRSPYWRSDAVWLPEFHTEGRADNRIRFDPTDSQVRAFRREAPPPVGLRFLVGFLLASARSAKDWGDHTRMRLPHVRNRVARLGLVNNEGELNIAMDRKTLLKMAHAYGSATGKLFVERFGVMPDGTAGPQWKDQRWVRLQVLVKGMRDLVRGFSRSADLPTAGAPSIEQALIAAKDGNPLTGEADRGGRLGQAQAADLQELIAAARALERAVENATQKQPWSGQPEAELSLRPPL